jgi:7-cyano-7-deazaguanine synthase
MKAVVVTGGGMDSTTALYVAMSSGYACETISFDYGQRHRKELASAALISERLGLKHHIVNLTCITSLIDSSALTGDIDVPEGHYTADNMAITVVPNRNSLMANVAIARAITIGASRVVLGIHSGDHAVYPDCRPEWLDALNTLASVANQGFLAKDFQIVAPFVNVDKATIARIGSNLGVPYQDTWTCYKGGDLHCGRCGTCVERLEAFHIAGLEDPVAYEDRNYYKEVCEID